MSARDTIAAVATAPGVGAVGILRLSGPAVPDIATAVLGRLPAPRVAQLAAFRAADGEVIDQGLVLYFPAPHSFTGEDVLELQGHGGPWCSTACSRACSPSAPARRGPASSSSAPFWKQA
jgi:Predicted GTPase